MRAGNKARLREGHHHHASAVGDGGDGNNGPPQLRQQSYLRLRPGAYWAAPGAEAVRAPAPAQLPAAAPDVNADADPELQEDTTTTTTTTTMGDGDAAAPSHPRQNLASGDTSVLLEAVPVTSILAKATPVPADPPSATPERSYRLRRVKRRAVVALLIAVAAIAAAAAAAGVVVGRSTGRGNLAANDGPPGSPPAGPPSSQPTRSRESTNACPTWEECLLGNNLDPQACMDCYQPSSSLVANGTACGAELTTLICQNIESCKSTCGACGSYIEAYEACQWGADCFLSCPYDSASSSEPTAPSSSSVAPAPTPAPTSGTPAPTYACPSELAAWAGCLQDQGLDAGACAACYSTYFDLVVFNETTCGELTALICAQIDTCTGSCGGCGSQIEAYEACNWGSDCFLSCPYPASEPTTSPTPAPAVGSPAPTYRCPSEIAAYTACLQDNSLDAGACIGCSNQYWDVLTNETTCDEVTALICRQIDSCAGSCGACGPSLEAYETCNWGSDCFQSCTGYPSATTTTSSSPAGPVGSPAPTSAQS